MGLLDSTDVSAEGHQVAHIRVDRIGAATEGGLWWVALGFEDGSTKPKGMFHGYDEAAALGADLAKQWGVEVVVTKVV
ncbi:MAG: hypothetical protein WBJ62_05300 [Coriobacteriia bacterium]|jgi:hypothetical protein